MTAAKGQAPTQGAGVTVTLITIKSIKDDNNNTVPLKGLCTTKKFKVEWQLADVTHIDAATVTCTVTSRTGLSTTTTQAQTTTMTSDSISIDVSNMAVTGVVSYLVEVTYSVSSTVLDNDARSLRVMHS